jgi:four helix bundle protein
MVTTIKKFTHLKAWQEAHKLTLLVYKATEKFPKHELTNQIRRAGVSVTSNLAEGFNRYSSKEKLQFYNIALGSISEVESQLLLAKDLNYVSPGEASSLFDKCELARMLILGLLKSIRNA